MTDRRKQFFPVLAMCALLWFSSEGAFPHPIRKVQTSGRDLRVEPANAVDRWPTSAKRFALVIGVDEYESSQINRLDGASNDAKAIAEAVNKYAGFPANQVILLTGDQPVQRRPTRNNILGRLSSLRAIVPPDGLILISFAGHGIQRNGHAYLLPTDAQLTDDLALLEETAINLDVITNWIRQARVSQVVLIIDACRNDPTAGRGDSENPLTEAYTRALSFDIRNRDVLAFATLFATNVGHVAYEYKERRQGYFTWALVQGLQGAAANQKGEVTLGGLKRYIEQEVPRLSVRDLGKTREQRPFAIIEGYRPEDLVISAVAPRSPSDRVSLDAAVVGDLDAWNRIRNSTKREEYLSYLAEWPTGLFAELARARLIRLESSGGASVEDLNLWLRIKASNKPDDYRSYLKEWPNGIFVELAAARLKSLEGLETSAPSIKPMIEIRSFENPPNYYNSTIGTGLSDLFITELQKTNSYEIVGRDGLQNSVDDRSKIKGLQYVFVCKVTNFGEKKSGAYVRLDFRVVENSTREVILAGSGEGEDSTKGASLDGVRPGSTPGAISFSDPAFLNSKVGRATLKAIKNVIDKLERGVLQKPSIKR